MARQRLVESFSSARSTYKNVTAEPKYQPLVESFKKNRKKLSESTIDGVKKRLTEAKLDNNLESKVRKNLQEAGLSDDIQLWQFPVSKINDHEHPNLNGRVYGRKLWENVVNNQADIWKGGTGLANHPADDEDGDFMLQSIVWLDGFIGDDGLIYGVGTFVGDGGALAQQIIDVGGRIGFSTSGYGDFLKDGIEVDPDDYEIDRFADLVLNPSQGVYGNHADAFKGKQEESVENKEGKKVVNESVERKPLNESEEEKAEEKRTFKAIIKGESKEFENFEDFKAELAKHLKDKDSKNDFDEIDMGEYADTYEGSESDYFDDVESTEVPGTSDGGTTLSEKLLVKHYTEAIKNINKKSNKFYEEKVAKLENLVKKLKKETFSESSKNMLNKQIEGLIESILKDTKKAITEGYEARELCEELEISSLSKLSNIKEKIEDFTSLEECLADATKEANKYKALYESKVNTAIADAKDSLKNEDTITSLKSEVSKLKENLRKANIALADANKLQEETEAEKAELSESLEKELATKKTLKERVLSLRKALNESREDIQTQKESFEGDVQEALKEAEKYKNALKKSQIREQVSGTEKSLSEKKALDERNALRGRISKLSEKNEKLQDLLNEAEKTIQSLQESSRAAKGKIAKYEAKIEILEKQLKETDKTNQTLRASLSSSRSKFRDLNEQYENTSSALENLKEKHLAEKAAKEKALAEKKDLLARSKSLKEENERIAEESKAEKAARFKAEKAARIASRQINEDFADDFRETDAIEDYYNQFDGDFEGYDDVKTLEAAQNRSLFDNDLFSDEVEDERSSIGVPTGDAPETLADMFN